MPTMYATIAYISSTTRRDDVDFHRSKRYDSDSLWQYVQRVVQRARERGITLLEIVVYRDDKEIWRGLI